MVRGYGVGERRMVVFPIFEDIKIKSGENV